MTACQALRTECEWSYSQLLRTLKEIPQELAWAQASLSPGSYLHSNGTVIGMVQHIAVCKFMYGSTAFRDTEIRWRDCLERLAAIDTSWEATKDYLDEAQTYWLSTWEGLTDEDLDGELMHFRGVKWPAWKIVAMINHHDAYHSGQIELLVSILTPTSQPPDMRLEDERKSMIDLPGY